jgi:glycosyltransferase involved in cell wall biosynthesis
VAAVLARWGVDEKKRVILHAARLTSWKGQEIVIEAAEFLHARGMLEDAVVVLAGDAQRRGSYRTALANKIRSAGLQDRVLIVGHEEDMAAAFRASHVAVVASVEPEAFGRAATEAQAMAAPVIATDIGAPPETVLGRPGVSMHRATGWLVPPSDALRLADAIGEALNMKPEERTRMGQRAREHVLEAFSLTAMKQQTLQVYDALLGTKLASPSASHAVLL